MAPWLQKALAITHPTMFKCLPLPSVSDLAGTKPWSEQNSDHPTVRVKIITGSLVTLENLFHENYRYRYRPEIRMNYHYRYRLGPRSRPFISIDPNYRLDSRL